MPLIKGKRLNIGKFTIGNSLSTVVTSIYDDDTHNLIEKLQRKNLSDRNLYEMRYDLFGNASLDNLYPFISALDEMDIDYIFTYRSNNPEKFYEDAITKMVPAVDIELGYIKKMPIRPVDTKIIVSYHGKDNKNIIEKIEEMASLDFDIVKAAAYYTDIESFLNDLVSVIDFKKSSGIPISFVPMGENSGFLRIISSYFVSDLVYAKYEKDTAPGQPEMSDYLDAFRLFSKLYRKIDTI
ncbi:MAG: type I 3-dehydroquinate dehydratase [Thermoplasmata archaeon]